MPEVFSHNNLNKIDSSPQQDVTNSDKFDSLYSTSLDDKKLEKKFSQKDSNNFNKIEENEQAEPRIDIILATIQQIALTIQEKSLLTPTTKTPTQSLLIHKSIVFVQTNSQDKSVTFTVPNQALEIKIIAQESRLHIQISSDVNNELKQHREQLLNQLKTIFDYEDIQIDVFSDTNPSFTGQNSQQEQNEQHKDDQEKEDKEDNDKVNQSLKDK